MSCLSEQKKKKRQSRFKQLCRCAFLYFFILTEGFIITPILASDCAIKTLVFRCIERIRIVFYQKVGGQYEDCLLNIDGEVYCSDIIKYDLLHKAYMMLVCFFDLVKFLLVQKHFTDPIGIDAFFRCACCVCYSLRIDPVYIRRIRNGEGFTILRVDQKGHN